jgi:hypothetical protein
MLFRDKLCKKNLSFQKNRIVNKFSFQESKNTFLLQKEIGAKDDWTSSLSLSTFWFYSGNQQLDYIASKVAIKKSNLFLAKKVLRRFVWRYNFSQQKCQQHKYNFKVLQVK